MSASSYTHRRPYQLPVVGGRHYLSLSLLLVPALVLSVAAAGPGHVPGDVAVMRFVQEQLPGGLSWLFEVVNLIGTTAGATVVTLALFCVLSAFRRPELAFLVFATLPLRLVNAGLKAIGDSPRPPEGLVRVTENAGGLGFPSGHTMGATVLYGLLLVLATRHIASRSLRLAAQIFSGAMIALAGLSRIYVGAHWPSDVLGGYIWGVIALLALFIAGRHLIPARWRANGRDRTPSTNQSAPRECRTT